MDMEDELLASSTKLQFNKTTSDEVVYVNRGMLTCILQLTFF